MFLSFYSFSSVIDNEKTKGAIVMPKRIKKEKQKALTLKEWIYPTDGKQIKVLIIDSFLEFYLTKNTNKRPNA
jgi:hypothetical protein